MANEEVGVEVLEKDILERAGIESRDDLPISIECTWGVNQDGSPRVFQAGEAHPLLPGHLIFAIFQTPTEIRIYSLCPQANGAPPSNAEEAKKAMRTNPTRTTLVKTSRCSTMEIMILDVFVAAIAQDIRELEFDTYGERKESQEIAEQITQLEPEALQDLIKQLGSQGYRVNIVPPKEAPPQQAPAPQPGS